MTDVADGTDRSADSTETKIIVPVKEQSMHLPGLNWDHNNDTLILSSGNNCIIKKLNTVLGLKPYQMPTTQLVL